MEQGQRDFLKNLLMKNAAALGIDIHNPLHVFMRARYLFEGIRKHVPATFTLEMFKEAIKTGARKNGIEII